MEKSSTQENKSNQSFIFPESGRISPPPQDPMAHALNLLGLRYSDLVRPLYYEEGYHIFGRIPLIDHVAQSPFFLQHWADDTSNNLQHMAKQGLSNTLAFILASINGGVSYMKTREPSTIVSGFLEAYRYLCRKYGVIPEDSVLDRIQQVGFSDAFDRHLGELIHRLTESTILARKAFAALNQEELSFLLSRPERYFYPHDRQFDFLTAATHTQLKIVTITRKIDFVSLYTSALYIAEALDRFSEYIKSIDDINNPAHFFANGGKRGGRVLDISSPIGKIVVLGQDNNVITGTGALVVDLGGNDRFTGPITAGHLEPGRISIAIDIDGNDIYDRKKKRSSQGFGCLSVGMLIDLAGDDQYLAGDMAQGSGIFGVGVLADIEGNDYYRMGVMGQGFGVFGIGLLIDKRGRDKYLITGMGQGAASTLGFGALCDLSGNDKYLADLNQPYGTLSTDEWSHVQGAGLSIRPPDWVKYPSFYGGIGFLSDGNGDDFYFASNGNCMGSSYFMSIGAFADHGGNDKYIPKGGYGLGCAVHLSNAVFIDHSGDDYYFGNIKTGGVGLDRSVAIMVDYAGNDVYGPSDVFVKNQIEKEVHQQNIYLSKEALHNRIQEKMAYISFGSALKPKALGFLIDVEGDDRYFARDQGKAESCGGVIPPADPQHWSYAFLLDLGGNDYYYTKERKNNHYINFFQHSLCYDTEYAGHKKNEKLSIAFRYPRSTARNNLPDNYKNISVYPDLLDLLNPDLFVRYPAIERISRHSPAVVDELIKVLSESTENEFNKDIVEIINTVLIRRQLKPQPGWKLQTLLTAKDPYVRIYAARLFGWQKITTAVPALLDALNEKNADVRSNIIWALGQLSSPEAIEPTIRIIDSDENLYCRRSAMVALATLAKKFAHEETSHRNNIKASLLRALGDRDEIIRTHAASALVHFGDDPKIMTTLQERLQDTSVYVQRASAKSIILNGVKAGIPVLIETLKYPSIDTFEHYDHELPKNLAFYCGIDFPNNQRYHYSTWSAWWQENGANINLKQNLAIMRDTQKAFEAPDEEKGIAIFKRLIAQHPSNVVVRKRYQRFCNDWITFRLLTQERKTPKILKRITRLLKILTEIEPQKHQTWAQLANYYATLKQPDDAISAIRAAIALAPKNEGYQKALTYFTRLKTIENE